MPTPGRPTLYHPDFAETAHNYCLLGATNADLAAFFEVAPRTVDNWLATHDDFAAAVRRGRAAADARVARCLYDKAVGYDRTVSRTVLHQGREHTLNHVVHVAPDTRACIFWLRNRQPAAWNGPPPGGGPRAREGHDGHDGPDAAEGDASAPGSGWRYLPPLRPQDLAAFDEAGRGAVAAARAALAARQGGLGAADAAGDAANGGQKETPPSREDGVDVGAVGAVGDADGAGGPGKGPGPDAAARSGR